jgi:excinuclease ABC subunit C
MHKCKGPCIGEQSKEEYTKHINDSREILKGNISQILKEMRSEMEQLGKDLNFEEAQQIKNKYEMLVSFQAKSEIVNASNTNIDVFNIETDDKHAYINYLHVVQGSIIQAFTFEYTKKMEESQEELLVMGIVEMRNRFKSTSKEIVIPFEIEYPDPDVTLTIPQKGDKKKLLDLSHLNVKQYKFDRLKQVESSHPEQKTLRLMTEIKDALHLPTLPVQIELFDNSNISGTDAVAGCVVFRKLKPSKSEYRKYNIKTVVGPDDYASMQEVVRRRYSRNIEENLPMPDLIITDGGIGQMNCVREVIEDELHLSIPIAGLAKNDKHRTNELLYGFPAQTIGMKTTSELFRLLTRMQDEVHRYAITFHRQKRSKHQTASELDSIKGVGESTKHLLLKEFKSVKRIKNADLTQLQNLLGKKKGENLYHAFHQDKQ